MTTKGLHPDSSVAQPDGWVTKQYGAILPLFWHHNAREMNRSMESRDTSTDTGRPVSESSRKKERLLEWRFNGPARIGDV